MRVNNTFSKPDILDILFSEGIEFKQKGWAFWVLCPFHSEKTASLKVDAEKQRFHCFSCGESGDVIDFISKHRQLSFPEALKYLGINTNIPFKPDPVEKHKQKLLSEFQAWKQQYFIKLCDCLVRLDRIKKQISSADMLEAFAWAYHKESLWNYRVEILTGIDTTVQIALYREVCHEQ